MISGIGTPALWWVAIFALVAALILWVGGRDWRFGIPVVGVLSGWLPWFQYDAPPAVLLLRDRDHPVLGDGRRAVPRPAARATRGPVDRRMIGGIVVGAFVALVAANFAYLYPILTDQLLPYPKWLARMWFRTWI